MIRRRRPTGKPPPFLRNVDAAVAWLKTNGAVMEVFDGMFPPEYPEQHRAPAIEDELHRVAWDYLERARDIVEAGSVTLFRSIRIPRRGGLHNINWDCLGKSWSAEYGGADVYGIAPGEGYVHRDVVLVGVVEPQYIDWVYGFESFAIYGKDQWEISLLPFSPVLIREVIIRPSTYRWSVGEERRVLSKPIWGSTGPAGEVWQVSCREVHSRPRQLSPEEAALEGLGMAEKPPLRLFEVFEVKGNIDFPVGRVEARSGLDALAKLAPSRITVHGLREDKDVCVTRFRERGSTEMRTWYAQPAKRLEP